MSKSPRRIESYHEKVCFRMGLVLLSSKDLGPSEVFWQRSSEVDVFERTQVFGLCRIRRSHLARFYRKFCFTQSPPAEQFVIYATVSFSISRMLQWTSS